MSTETSSTVDVLEQRAPERAPMQPFGAYLFRGDEPEAAIGRGLEQKVFLETFGNTPEVFESEYGPYESASMFFVVMDHLLGVPAGVMRLIVPVPGRSGLKSLDDVEPEWGAPPEALIARAGLHFDPARTWDIATLAVDPAYRNASAQGLVSLGLYQSVVRTSRAMGVDWLVAILDHLVLRMARVAFASPFDPYAEGRPYLGSLSSSPVLVDLQAWDERLGAKDPVIHDIIYGGVGIEPALAPLNLDHAVERLAPMWPRP